jgi:hypothetical protein
MAWTGHPQCKIQMQTTLGTATPTPADAGLNPDDNLDIYQLIAIQKLEAMERHLYKIYKSKHSFLT